MVFKITAVSNNARVGLVRTRHGDFETPTIFPVHNLGADAGWNTPFYWKVFPEMNTGMFNTASLHMDKRHRLGSILRSGVHNYTQFPGIIFLDSGGYIYRKYGLKVSQEELFNLQMRMGGDIVSTLDFPFLLSDRPQDKDITSSVQNAREVLTFRKRKGVLLYASVHGYDPSILQNVIRHLRRSGEFDGLALGSLMRSFSSHELVIDLVLTLRKEAPDLPLHVYGLGGPIISTLLAYLGVDSVDSSMFVINAGKRQYLLPNLKRVSVGELEGRNLPCECKICSSHTAKDLRKDRSLLSFHNLWICWENMNQIRRAIKEDRIEEYIEKAFVPAPWAQKALNYARHRLTLGIRAS